LSFQLIVDALEVHDEMNVAILLGNSKGWEAPFSTLDFFWGESSHGSDLALSFNFSLDCFSLR
jgi:hypothetical protein